MPLSPQPILPDNPPELPVVFDLTSAAARTSLRGMRRAWGSRATVENLYPDRAVLVIRPGGAADRRGAA